MPALNHRHSVLLVDDYEPFLEATEALLGVNGYEVSTASSAYEALTILRDGFLPCVALVDVSMPGLDGRTLQALLASRPAWSAIAVVIVSGASDVVAASRAGMPGVLAKPVDPDALVAAIEQYARCVTAPPGSTHGARRSTAQFRPAFSAR